MTLVPFGVSKVMKNKSQKSAHITEFLIGHNSDSSVLSIQAVSEEVNLSSIPFCIKRIFLIVLKDK